MIIEQHYLDCLSQASYFIGDKTTGRAVIVDPRRDIAPYLESASEHGMQIELSIQTHFHADFLSGHLELEKATGAPIAFGSAASPEFPTRLLEDGERISLGQVELEILHTPGHTPESISIVVYEGPDQPPHAVLTGDTLFIGDVGRPDLLASVGFTADELAAKLYNSLHNKLMTLPDDTILYPGHGAGSACGKNLSSETSCTIGRQRENNYAVQPMTENEFIQVVTEGQPGAPSYFVHDAILNRKMRPVFDDAASTEMDLDAVLAAQANGAVVLDARDPVEFNQGHLAGSINVGLSGRFAEYAGGIVAADDEIVILAEQGHAEEARVRLGRIGFDNVIGHVADPAAVLGDSQDKVRPGSRLDVRGLVDAMQNVENLQLVDVRQPGETSAGTIEGAIVIPLTEINARLSELDSERPTAIYCAGGYRSSIVASRLRAAGFEDVSDLIGGYGAWQSAHATA